MNSADGTGPSVFITRFYSILRAEVLSLSVYYILSALSLSLIVYAGYPLLVQDMQAACTQMQDSGSVDPFELSRSVGTSTTYSTGTGITETDLQIILQSLVRLICPDEIVEDPAQVAHITALLNTLKDPYSTAVSCLLSWIPGSSNLTRIYHGAKLYHTIDTAVQKRRRLEYDPSDPVQHMLDKGDTTRDILSVRLWSHISGPMRS